MSDLGNMNALQVNLVRTLRPISQGSKPDLYLRSRGITLTPKVSDLRMDKDQNMVALVRDKGGDVVSYQRTFLTQRNDGILEHRRMQARGVKIPHGSAIRLYEPSKEMGIAESTEDAISAAKLLKMPVWSAISSGQLETWLPPKGVEKVHIFAQLDKNSVGELSALRLQDEIGARGIEVVTHFPELIFGDWNDFLKENSERKSCLSL